MLVVCIVLAALVTLGYLPAHGFWPFLALSLLHAASLAPVTILADALALGAAAPSPGSGRRGFEYGWVRGTGSAAFIGGTLLSGQAVSAWGLDNCRVAGPATGRGRCGRALVPERGMSAPRRPCARRPAEALLLRLPRFRRLVLVAALILGSHAMHDAFAVIRWRAAGVSPAMASVLWSESVAAEVLVFFLIGPALVTWLTPAGALAVAALAGLLRWTVMAQSAAVLALALVQPLHGITLRCCISPACGCSPGSCRQASKGRRRRSTARSALGPSPRASPWFPAPSTPAWERTGFGSWRRCACWPSRRRGS